MSEPTDKLKAKETLPIKGKDRDRGVSASTGKKRGITWNDTVTIEADESDHDKHHHSVSQSKSRPHPHPRRHLREVSADAFKNISVDAKRESASARMKEKAEILEKLTSDNVETYIEYLLEVEDPNVDNPLYHFSRCLFDKKCTTLPRGFIVKAKVDRMVKSRGELDRLRFKYVVFDAIEGHYNSAHKMIVSDQQVIGSIRGIVNDAKERILKILEGMDSAGKTEAVKSQE